MSTGERALIVASYPRSVILFRLELIRTMRRSGAAVHIATAEGPGLADIRRLLSAEDVFVHGCPISRAGINPFQDVRFFLALLKIIRRVKPTVLLPYTIKPVIYGTIAGWLMGVPRRYALITGLGYAFIGDNRGALRRIVAWLYRFALSRASKVFFQNSDDEAMFRSIILPPQVQSIVVNGSGVDLDAFEVRPLPSGPPVFFDGWSTAGRQGCARIC